MFINILAFICSLVIASVAAYYSIIGLMSIFAAAAIPIAIMGAALESGKLITATWLYDNWKKTPFLLKTYLTTAVVVLMFITSMGIFGFLSKAHIEQTAGAQEGLAQIDRIVDDISRLEQSIQRSETVIKESQVKQSNNNDSIQEQIDKEQERIDSAYERAQPAIDEQLKIIETETAALSDKISSYEKDIQSLDEESQRLIKLSNQYKEDLNNITISNVGGETKPYLDQIELLNQELDIVNSQIAEYETKLDNLEIDNSIIEKIESQVKELEENIIDITTKLQSRDKDKIRQGQAIIGVTTDGLFGNNTNRALTSWVDSQRKRISQLETQIANLRITASEDVKEEKERLTGLIADLRNNKLKSIDDRKQRLLNTVENIRSKALDDLDSNKQEIQQKIDDILKTQLPGIRSLRQNAQDQIKNLQNQENAKIEASRNKISNIRNQVNDQIIVSQNLIAKLRDNLSIGDDEKSNAIIENEEQNIRDYSAEIEELYAKKFNLEAEYRKYETEVGPVKYIAEFVYKDEANNDLLEEAVRWVIIIIILVFDPLAVLLLIAANIGFKSHRKEKKEKEETETVYYEENDDSVTIDKNKILTL